MLFLKFIAAFVTSLFVLSTILSPDVLGRSERTQSARIVGQVVSEEDDSPLAHVNVFIAALQRGDVSNLDGEFEIDRLPPGDFLLAFRLQGYESYDSKPLRLTPNQTIELKVRLRSKVVELDQMVVTARRSQDRTSEVPQLVTVITPRRIQERNVAQTPELLREEAGVAVQKTNQGGGSPIIRGFRANKVLLLIDGVRLNNSTYRGGNTQYLGTHDSGALQQVEVVHGPQAVAYGSDALGGTINLITRSPALNQVAKWQASTRLASAENSVITQAGVETGSDKLGLLVQGSFKSFGDVKRGSGGGGELMRRLRNDSRVTRVLNKTQAPNGYDSYDLHSSVLLKLSEARRFTAVYQLSRQSKVPRYDVIETGKDSVRLFDPQERDLVYLKYTDADTARLYDRLAATVSFHRQAERRKRIKVGGSVESRDRFRTATAGFQVQLDKTLAGRHETQYGAEFYFDNVATSSNARNLSNNEIRPAAPLFPDGSTFKTLGFYGQNAVLFTDRLRVIAGARLNFSRLQAPFVSDANSDDIFGNIEQTSTAVTGSLGARYAVSGSLNLVGSFAQGFRTPNLDDVSKLGPGKGSSFFDVPNPDVDPERTWSVDVGVKAHSHNLRMDIVGFYTRINDLLIRRPAEFRGSPIIVDDGDTLAVFHKENAGRAYTTGLALHGEFALSGSVAVFADAGYTYGQNLSDDEPLSAIPPFSGSVGARFRSARYGLELNTRFAAAQSRLAAVDREDLRIPERGTPSWVTFNFRSNARLLSFLSVHFEVANVLDANYREHLSGFNAPGRNFIVGANLNY